METMSNLAASAVLAPFAVTRSTDALTRDVVRDGAQEAIDYLQGRRNEPEQQALDLAYAGYRIGFSTADPDKAGFDAWLYGLFAGGWRYVMQRATPTD